MSNMNVRMNSSSYVSFSSSSSLSSGGQNMQQSFSQQISSDPRGTTTRVTTQRNGEAPVEETRHYDSQGRQLLTASGNKQPAQGRIEDVEVEDVTDEADADKKYREAMEDEYAKREGGA